MLKTAITAEIFPNDRSKIRYYRLSRAGFEKVRANLRNTTARRPSLVSAFRTAHKTTNVLETLLSPNEKCHSQASLVSQRLSSGSQNDKRFGNSAVSKREMPFVIATIYVTSNHKYVTTHRRPVHEYVHGKNPEGTYMP